MRHYEKQRDHGGVFGPEGYGWERFDYESPNHVGMVGMPHEMQEELCEQGEWEATPDGRRWPKPMQLLMEEGDAYILVGSMAHAGTRNDLGTESRKSLIFRLISDAHNPGGPQATKQGLSDHPVRFHRSSSRSLFRTEACILVR